jgi:hypothetical protein
MTRLVLRGSLVALLILLFAIPARAQQALPEPVDEDAVSLIRAHGLDSSQVMDHVHWLADVYGPRLTGSPNLDRASQWLLSTFEAWGLENVHLDEWGPFGQGWTLDRFAMHVTSPVRFPVHALPKAWSSGIDGPVTAEVVVFDPDSVEAFSEYDGKLEGKVVLLTDPRAPDEPFEPGATRHDAEKLHDLATAATASEGGRRYSDAQMARYRLNQAKLGFLYEQQPLAVLDVGYDRGDYGTIFTSYAALPADPEASWFDQPKPWQLDATPALPQITVAAEHYNRLYRLIERGEPVEIELDLGVTFHDEDPMEYNVIAEIPGTDPAIGEEVVILGGHLDSWHAGTGATDNAAGVAVMMEAVRLLQETFASLDEQPRRTIRLALWTGEEQGLHGSVDYVRDQYADLPSWTQPPTALKPAQETVSAYYNMDNGTGKIRGVYLQGNDAVAPIFRSWLAPFHDLGAATLTISNTSSTDHIPFDRAGIPGFQFIQDPIAYGRTHHSNMDVVDHVLEDDLKQAATIVAAFAYHTAQRDAKLPRKPLQLAQPETVGSR